MGVVLSTLLSALDVKTIIFDLVLASFLGYVVTILTSSRIHPSAQGLQGPHIKSVRSSGIEDSILPGMHNVKLALICVHMYRLAELYYYHGNGPSEWSFKEFVTLGRLYIILFATFWLWMKDVVDAEDEETVQPATSAGALPLDMLTESAVDALTQRTVDICTERAHHRAEVKKLRSELFRARATAGKLGRDNTSIKRTVRPLVNICFYQQGNLAIAQKENDRLDRILIEFQGAFDQHHEREQKLHDLERSIRCFKNCFQHQERHVTNLQNEVAASKQRAEHAEVETGLALYRAAVAEAKAKVATKAAIEAETRERAMLECEPVWNVWHWVHWSRFRAEIDAPEHIEDVSQYPESVWGRN